MAEKKKKKDYYEHVLMPKVRDAWIDPELIKLTGIDNLFDKTATFKRELSREELIECYHRTLAMERTMSDAVDIIEVKLKEHNKKHPEDIDNLYAYETAKIKLFRRCNDKFLVDIIRSALLDSRADYRNHKFRKEYDEKVAGYSDEELHGKALKRVNGLLTWEGFYAHHIGGELVECVLTNGFAKLADIHEEYKSGKTIED